MHFLFRKLLRERLDAGIIAGGCVLTHGVRMGLCWAHPGPETGSCGFWMENSLCASAVLPSGHLGSTERSWLPPALHPIVKSGRWRRCFCRGSIRKGCWACPTPAGNGSQRVVALDCPPAKRHFQQRPGGHGPTKNFRCVC